MFDCDDTDGLAPAYTPAAVLSVCPNVVGATDCMPFWLEPVSVFGSSNFTVPVAVHLCWAFHPALPSDRIDARSRGDLLTDVSPS